MHYISQKGGFKISWGDGTYQRAYDSLFTCENNDKTGLWDEIPRYHSETTNTLVFVSPYETSSGGNPSPISFQALILPKNQRDSIYTKEYFLASIQGYLVYCASYYAFDKIAVQNLETKKTQKITLRPKPLLIRTPGLSIDSVQIEKGRVFITYRHKIVESKNDENPFEEVSIKKSYKLTN